MYYKQVLVSLCDVQNTKFQLVGNSYLIYFTYLKVQLNSPNTHIHTYTIILHTHTHTQQYVYVSVIRFQIVFSRRCFYRKQEQTHTFFYMIKNSIELSPHTHIHTYTVVLHTHIRIQQYVSVCVICFKIVFLEGASLVNKNSMKIEKFITLYSRFVQNTMRLFFCTFEISGSMLFRWRENSVFKRICVRISMRLVSPFQWSLKSTRPLNYACDSDNHFF